MGEREKIKSLESNINKKQYNKSQIDKLANQH